MAIHLDPNPQRIPILDEFGDSDSESDDDDRLSSVVACVTLGIVIPEMRKDVSNLLRKRTFSNEDSNPTAEKVRRVAIVAKLNSLHASKTKDLKKEAPCDH